MVATNSPPPPPPTSPISCYLLFITRMQVTSLCSKDRERDNAPRTQAAVIVFAYSFDLHSSSSVIEWTAPRMHISVCFAPPRDGSVDFPRLRGWCERVSLSYLCACGAPAMTVQTVDAPASEKLHGLVLIPLQVYFILRRVIRSNIKWPPN